MTLRDLFDGQLVNYRTGSIAAGPDPVWTDWTLGKLFVSTRSNSVPRSWHDTTRYGVRGDPCLIGIRGKDVEFKPDDFENGIFLCENRCMEIEGLVAA